MMSSTPSNPAIAALQRQVRQLRVAVAALGLLALGGATLALRPTAPDVLRVRGLVVVDDAGRARILLGAPAPSTTERIRHDAQTSSLVFLGPDGADRVIVGDLPNPRIDGRTYPRVGGAYGLLIHDRKGNERGGISELDNGRRVISLDRPGQDAIEMVVNDVSGFAGLTANFARPLGQYVEGVRLGTRGDSAWLALSDTAGSLTVRLPTGQ